MCGIGGVFGGGLGLAERRERLGFMMGRLAHRGPDGWGTWVAPGAGLGHVRLSIVDLADGSQPFTLGDDAISFNGEVFNYIELRRDLEALGEVFRTRSDTEVLLVALRRWGLDAMPRLNGQYAFLYWDGSRRRLIAGRDRYGIVPLYHCTHQGATYFASEMKAFDAVPGLERRLSPPDVLEHGLLWNTLEDRTVWQGIRSVEMGTCLVLEPDLPPKSVRYYQLGQGSPDPVPTDFEETKRVLREKLLKSITLRLRSDVPVGNYLSGGIDSSVVTLLTAQLRSDRFRTFSIAFEDKGYDESPYQDLVTAALRSESTEPFRLTVKKTDIRDNFERCVRHGERPLFRTAPVPLLLLSRAVRESGIRVVLTGEAADEILWGYDAFKELKLLRFWARFPKSRLRPQLLRTLYPHLSHYRDATQFGQMRMFYEGFLDNYDDELAGLNLRVHNNAILRSYLRPEHRESVGVELLRERLGAVAPVEGPFSLLQRNQILEMRTLLPGYLLSSQADRMCLANAIEGRYPFLDHELVEWVFKVPDRFKLPLLSHKHLLREAFRPDLPAEVIDRPKQPYQAPDLKAFFQDDGQMCELARVHLAKGAIEAEGIFDPKMIERFVNKFARGIPTRLGYRDNMLFVFMLSAQIAAAHARERLAPAVPTTRRTVDVVADGRAA
jgi:asparagine synthase (glutamine-hydrolysing)